MSQYQHSPATLRPLDGDFEADEDAPEIEHVNPGQYWSNARFAATVESVDQTVEEAEFNGPSTFPGAHDRIGLRTLSHRRASDQSSALLDNDFGARSPSSSNYSSLHELSDKGDSSGPQYFSEWDTIAGKYLASNAKTYLAFFKAFVGTGILFLSKGFDNGGMTGSILTFIVVTYLATLCMLRMYYAKQKLAEDFKAGNYHGVTKPFKVISFGMLARVAMGRPGRWLVDGSIVLSQLGFAGSALIFCSKNIINLVQSLSHCEHDVAKYVVILCMVPGLIPMVWIRQLTRFSFCILIADACIVGGIIFLFIRNLMRLSEYGVAPGIHQFTGMNYFVFLGAALYALEGTAFVLPIELSMQNKQDFPRVTVISSIAVGFLYMIFGMVGYLAYGSEAQTVIILNLQEENPHDKSVVVLQLVYVLALLLAYPFVMYPAVRIIEASVFKNRKSTTVTWQKNALRTVLVFFTAACAIVGSSTYDNFIGLIGGLACVPLTLIYPALFHLIICKNQLTSFEKWSNYVILVLGTFGAAATTAISLKEWIGGDGDAPLTPCVP